MKTAGIIGGVGPESTVAYYRAIIAAWRERKQDESYPSVIINSIDLTKIVDMFEANNLAGVTEYLVREIHRLARAGTDFGLIAANTPHIVFDDLQRESPIPLVSIVQATCDSAKSLGLTRLGLFGTRFTMRGQFYPDVFSREGITLATPSPAEQDWIHDKYMNELVKGIFLNETRDRLLAIADQMKRTEGIEGLILGGTELPLILQGDTGCGIPLLDTSQIHVEAVVSRLME